MPRKCLQITPFRYLIELVLRRVRFSGQELPTGFIFSNMPSRAACSADNVGPSKSFPTTSPTPLKTATLESKMAGQPNMGYEESFSQEPAVNTVGSGLSDITKESLRWHSLTPPCPAPVRPSAHGSPRGSSGGGGGGGGDDGGGGGDDGGGGGDDGGGGHRETKTTIFATLPSSLTPPATPFAGRGIAEERNAGDVEDETNPPFREVLTRQWPHRFRGAACFEAATLSLHDTPDSWHRGVSNRRGDSNGSGGGVAEPEVRWSRQ